MIRNERNTVGRLLRAAHSTHRDPALPPHWRSSVMAELRRLDPRPALASDMERLAPRFAMAATALCCLGLIAATLSLRALPAQVYGAYAAQTYAISPFLSM